MRRFIQPDAAHFHAVGLDRLASPQDGLNPRHQDLGTEGLGNILVHSQFKTKELVPLLSLGRQHDDRNLRILADSPHRLITVHLRHHHVHDDQTDILVREEKINRFFSVSRLQHRKIFFGQEIFHQLPHSAFIIHH